MTTIHTGVLAAVSAALGASVASAFCHFRQKRDAKRRLQTADESDCEDYQPPHWAPTELKALPKQRLRLAHLPTPIHRWRNVPGLPESAIELWIKRDDCTGSELSGNKVRKLEFLLAEAKASGCDCVITVGGIQSNHCRATAVAARRMGLVAHIILRTAEGQQTEDPGLVRICISFLCNLLVDRIVDAQIHLVGQEKFAAEGGWELVCQLKSRLEAAGHRPYAFPSGGSNSIGTWGYLEAVAELEAQVAESNYELDFDAVYFACGSGGTAAGLSLGLHCSSLRAELIGLGVDDSPSFFYDKIDKIYAQLGWGSNDPQFTPSSKEILRIVDSVGCGYAHSTEEELRFIADIAASTGVVLDPVYTGKAALAMVKDLQAKAQLMISSQRRQRVLFIHTGGLLGLYEKANELAPMLKGCTEL